MIWIPVAAIIVYAMARTMIFDPIMMPETWYGWFLGSIFQLFVSAFACLLISGAAYGVGKLFPTKAYIAYKTTLDVIRDKDGIEGRFFLGSGAIESKPYYFFYSHNSDGSVSPGKVQADSSVRVYQEDRADAEMVTWGYHSTSSWAWLVAIPPESDALSYDFHVPKGTVKPGYSM